MKLFKMALITSMLFSYTALANIDLKDGYSGQSKWDFLRSVENGERVVFNFGGHRPQYVESIVIAAEGRQRAYSFGKVYADGVEIATLGIPGYDPTYPIVVRGHVSTIEVVAQANSHFKILDFKIFTTPKKYSSYTNRRGSSDQIGVHQWGSEVLDVIYELDAFVKIATSNERNLFIELKRRALKVTASERVRDERSLKTFKLVSELLAIISEVETILLENDQLLINHDADGVITDLLTIKEDILEKYDLN